MTSERPACVMPAQMCGCEWFYLPDPFAQPLVSARYTHGSNPEHSRVFTSDEVIDTDICNRGHLVIVEDWIARTMAYAHPTTVDLT